MHRSTTFLICIALAAPGMMASSFAHRSFIPKDFFKLTPPAGNANVRSLTVDDVEETPDEAEAAAKRELLAKARITKAPETQAKWLAKSQDLFVRAGSGWMIYMEYDLDFNGKGLCIQENINSDYLHQAAHKTYSWNENDQVAEGVSQQSLYGSEFTNFDRALWYYDPVVTDFVTEWQHMSWKNSQWVMQTDSYKEIVTRNDAGNVISVERQEYQYNGDYRPVSRILIEYGDDGKASAITEEEVYRKLADGTYEWGLVEAYEDIVWDTTDGQIMSTDNLFVGANRMLSASLRDDSSDGTMTVEYGDRGSFTVRYTGYDEMSGEDEQMELTAVMLDDNGSAEKTLTVVNSVDGEETGSMMSYQRQDVDAYGNILLQEVKEEIDGRVVQYGKALGEVEYDSSYGYPVTWTFGQVDPDTDKMVPTTLVEYSDYNNYAGVEEISASEAAADAEALYFDMQGRRVGNPARGGIYIRRTGLRSEKVIVK